MMGYDATWSYSKYLQEQNATFMLPDGVSVNLPGTATKECRCESHYLFCWGHEKQCDYYEDKK